ncbi:benzoate-CoA ligase family protein [Halobacillus naozhouensis]|uniref:Benzoate-CoA ligase family protein n=1 Tax=Halobacillus naozhouensis TaxID=554880 RepID=A0ABY8IYT4_9BACI|nr:benzoate-CoA ligase family protein [Halobacillus naozhouensis]WFT75363.1 benzoate-CoA ligase family protein [Halobacillus naozhouensis]
MLQSVDTLRGIKDSYNAAVRFVDDNVKNGNQNKIAIACGEDELTYQQLSHQMNQFGNALLDIGLEIENRILLSLPDSPEFVVSFFGSVKIGAVPIPVNTNLQPHDYEYFLNHSRAKVFVVYEELWEELKAYKDRFPFLKHVIIVSDKGSSIEELNFHTFIAKASHQLDESYPTTSEDSAFWLYSSGSTGTPKGVIHRQRSMESAYYNYAVNILNIQSDDIAFSASKLYFAYGLGNGMYFPFGSGATAILLKDKPTPEKVFETIEEKKPTIFFGVPTLYGAMINYVEKIGRIPDLSSVRVCVSAGEALPASYVKKWRELFNVDILDGIGSTEALHIFLSNQSGQVQPGSTGKIVPGYNAKIVNEDGQTLCANEVGDLVIKGDSIASGYWCNLTENYHKFKGEWMYTGDKYYQDDDGYFWYCGRSDDMLKVGGIWVSPIEIESTLLQHEDVLEVAVVGETNTANLVHPKAYVILKELEKASGELAESLKLYVKDQLAPYKYPREIEFIEELPKTATGKIQRFKLKT